VAREIWSERPENQAHTGALKSANCALARMLLKMATESALLARVIKRAKAHLSPALGLMCISLFARILASAVTAYARPVSAAEKAAAHAAIDTMDGGQRPGFTVAWGMASPEGCMGLDFYELYLELGEDFDVNLADSSELPAAHVGELFDALITTIREQRPKRFMANPDYEQEAWNMYVEILVNQLGVKRERIVRSAHFVDDLNCY
jgi:hypothetical protein